MVHVAMFPLQLQKQTHVCGWGGGGSRLGTKMLAVVFPGR